MKEEQKEEQKAEQEKEQAKLAIISIATVLVAVGGLGIVALVAYGLFPLFLKHCDKDAVSILNAYKYAIILFYVAAIGYYISLIYITNLFTQKVAKKKILKPRLVFRTYIVIAMFFGISLLFFESNSDALEAYGKISADIRQYKSGDVSYSTVKIYMQNNEEDFGNRRVEDIFDVDYDVAALFKRIETIDPTNRILSTDDDLSAKTNDMFTYYCLPENVEFDSSEVQKVEPYDRNEDSLNYFCETLEPLYESNVVYRIGHTDNYNIIYSIEKVVQ